MAAIKSFLKIILYKPLFNILVFLVWLIPGRNIGIPIIILTVLIRLALMPSSAKAIVAQKQLKELQPELDKLKEKYKSDQKAQSKAMMELYQQKKINPLGGCLPLLIQLPVLLVLYYVFRAGLTTDRYSELLYTFTPRPETISTFFLGADLASPNIYLAVLAGISQFIQARQLSATTQQTKKSGKPAQENMLQDMLSKQLIYITPVFTVIVAMKLPSALALYWVVTTLFAIFQQWWIYKKDPLDKTGVSVTVKNR